MAETTGTIAQVAVLITATLGGIAGILAALAQRKQGKVDVEKAARDALQAERAAITAEYRLLFDDVKNEAVRDRETYDREIAKVNARAEEAAVAARAAAAERDDCRVELLAVTNRLRILEARVSELGG
jgi:Skp family chaperone for outer membrane proteins